MTLECRCDVCFICVGKQSQSHANLIVTAPKLFSHQATLLSRPWVRVGTPPTKAGRGSRSTCYHGTLPVWIRALGLWLYRQVQDEFKETREQDPEQGHQRQQRHKSYSHAELAQSAVRQQRYQRRQHEPYGTVQSSRTLRQH